MRVFLLLLLLCFVGVSPTSAQALLTGPDGLRYQVQKYLLDNDQDAATLYRSRDVVVRKIEGGEALVWWNVPGLNPPVSADLDTVLDSATVLGSATTSLKRVSGKWRLKTPEELTTEQAESPEGVRKAKQLAVKNTLRTELTAAGFTNQTYTLDEVLSWLDTVSLQANAEKKINRLATQLMNLYQPTIKAAP